MARYAIPSDNALRRVDGQHEGAGQAPRPESRARRRALGHRLVRGPHARPRSSTSRRASRRRRWTAGAGTSTTGPSATPLCFHLFDRTPHAWGKVAQWSGKRDEFVKRAAFALLWGLTVHDKQAGDEPFGQGLRLIERAATDERNFVKKAVNMALRAIGKRNPALNAAAVAVARRLADSPEAAARWVGKDALRELTSPAVTRRLARAR